MTTNISYDKFFRIINCKKIIFFEDDFSFSDKKDNLIYDFTRMCEISKVDFLLAIKKDYPVLVEHLQSFRKLFDKYLMDIDWNNDVIRGDINSAIDAINKFSIDEASQLVKIYMEIEIPAEPSILTIFNQHGLGVNVPVYYKKIFDEYIFKDNEWKSFKIYEDFTAEISSLLTTDMKKNSAGDTIVCVIDNQLSSGEQRAQSIIKTIIDYNSETRNNIIGAVLSSRDRKEEFVKEFFAEYVDKKDNENLQTNLQKALTKSAYSVVLGRLKELYLTTLETSFDEAIANRDIASYLSKMASHEGITNYKVVTDWIQLLFTYKISDNDEIFDLIKLTQLIDSLDGEETEYSQEMLNLNTFEAFDYNVNKYFQPAAAGDIFVNLQGEYYILVGQDCDIVSSLTRNANNAVMEFVKADVVLQTSISKQNNNLEYMCVDNFRTVKEGEVKRLQIKYSSRAFIDNAIIKLCSYNKNGNCSIALKALLENTVSDFLPTYLVSEYQELQKYFHSIRTLNECSREELHLILNTKLSPRLVSLTQYNVDENDYIDYGLKRICRMNRSYVLFLYKLFLEYRGRHPFDCINLSRHSSFEASIFENESFQIPFDVVLSNDRNKNRNHLKKLKWFIKPKDLENVVMKVHKQEIKLVEKELIVIDNNPSLFDCEESGIKIMLTKKPKAQLSIEIRQ